MQTNGRSLSFNQIFIAAMFLALGVLQLIPIAWKISEAARSAWRTHSGALFIPVQHTELKISIGGLEFGGSNSLIFLTLLGITFSAIGLMMLLSRRRRPI